jgi:hypothetical protein
VASLKHVEDRTIQFISEYQRLSKAKDFPTHEKLAEIIGANGGNTITEILGKRQNIKPEQWKSFKKHFKIDVDKTEGVDGNSRKDATSEMDVCYINFTDATGETIQITPGNKNEITLFNTLLKERDRVIDILMDEKEKLYNLLNSDLQDISKATNLIFAMARTALQYHAHVASGGNDERERELLDSLSLRIGDNLKVDVKQDSASSLSMSSK